MMRGKDYWIIFIGQAISLIGSAVQRCSLSLFLLDITGSAQIFANVLALSAIPYILLAPFAGTAADIFDRKKNMVVLDMLSALTIAIYFFGFIDGAYSVPALSVTMFLLAAIAAIYAPSVTASIPQVVDKENIVRANGMIQMVSSGANLAGPVIAGILYGMFGIRVILAINIVCFLGSALMEVFLRPLPPERKSEKSIWKEAIEAPMQMKSGFDYLRYEKRKVLKIIMTFGFYNLAITPLLSILFPYIIKIILLMPDRVYGVAEAVVASGLLLGGGIVSIRPERFPLGRVRYLLYPMFAALSVMAVGIAVINNGTFILLLIIGGCGVIMTSLSSSNVVFLSYIQQHVNQGRLGKVSAFSTAVATLFTPIGQVVWGRLIESPIPIWGILGITAVINLVVTWFVCSYTKLYPGEKTAC